MSDCGSPGGRGGGGSGRVGRRPAPREGWREGGAGGWGRVGQPRGGCGVGRPPASHHDEGEEVPPLVPPDAEVKPGSVAGLPRHAVVVGPRREHKLGGGGSLPGLAQVGRVEVRAEGEGTDLLGWGEAGGQVPSAGAPRGRGGGGCRFQARGGVCPRLGGKGGARGPTCVTVPTRSMDDRPMSPGTLCERGLCDALLARGGEGCSDRTSQTLDSFQGSSSGRLQSSKAAWSAFCRALIVHVSVTPPYRTGFHVFFAPSRTSPLLRLHSRASWPVNAAGEAHMSKFWRRAPILQALSRVWCRREGTASVSCRRTQDVSHPNRRPSSFSADIPSSRHDSPSS